MTKQVSIQLQATLRKTFMSGGLAFRGQFARN